MKEFVMVYRSELMGEIKLTAEGNMVVSKEWENWMGGIAAQNKLVSPGMRLGNEGRVIKPGNVVTNGPYAEIKEIIGGLSIFKADSIEEATEWAKTCPILNAGGNVEIRDIIQVNG
ncbi:MAG: transcription initiation protein [Bacteroidetes bacterium]|nr:transcription initiation protein [Bacteroidota bacterium]